eukprot:TRINITY_DN24268_c0_g1_i1.p1 TRINITY_DN24268_c0_g1~~TRINITY_DN24268_c0_g1_i1.p1  ORF type:complete len:513 (+),score=82.96 TRINITY_DN24268_c0_g1_i1:311-1849(+)
MLHVSQELRRDHHFNIAAVENGCSLEFLAPKEQSWMKKRAALRENMKEALGSRSVEVIEDSIEEAEKHGMPESDLEESKNYLALWSKYVVVSYLWRPLSVQFRRKAPAVVLLKGTWLAELAERGGRLPRRQDLPDEAVWRVADLQRGFDEYDHRARSCRPPKIVAVSHPWLRREHPDPHGDQVKQLLPLIKSRLRDLGPGSELAVFLDYCSLFQEPRTATEEELYLESMRDIGLWYANLKTETWLLTDTPETCSLPADITGDPGATAVASTGDRGWMMFERAIAGLVAIEGVGARNSLLDISKFEDESMEWKDVATNYGADRSPPMLPDEFNEELASKVFGRQEDLALLQRMYRDTFNEVMASTSVFILCDLGWADEEACKMAVAISSCSMLRGIELEGNLISNRGISSLMEALSHCTLLESIILCSNDIGDAGAEAMAKILPACKCLQEVDLSYNTIGNVGAAAFIAMFENGGIPSLKQLRLDRNDIGRFQRDRLQQAALRVQPSGFDFRV